MLSDKRDISDKNYISKTEKIEDLLISDQNNISKTEKIEDSLFISDKKDIPKIEK